MAETVRACDVRRGDTIGLDMGIGEAFKPNQIVEIVDKDVGAEGTILRGYLPKNNEPVILLKPNNRTISRISRVEPATGRVIYP